MSYNFPDTPTLNQVFGNYTWDGEKWAQTGGIAVPLPATATPLMNGTAAVGTATKYTREDHVHPSDTTLAPLASPTFTGDPKAPTPTAGDNDTSIATTAFVTGAVSTDAALRVAKAGDVMTGSLYWGGASSGLPGGGNTTIGGVLFNTGGGDGAVISLCRNSPGAMYVNINVDGGLIACYRSGTQVGGIAVTTTGTAYNTSSDGRLKEDLKTFDAGRIVDETNVYDFAWKTTGERSFGIIAQQAVTVYPAAITYNEAQDWWGIDYSRYVPVLLQELKALRARVAQLEAGMAAPR